MSGVTICIDAAELGLAREALAGLGEVIEEGVARGVFEAGLLLEREVKERTPTGAGTLRDSIAAGLPERKGGEVLGVVGSPLAYALPVELGTQPHMPPVQPLIDWVALKLGVKGKEGRGIAWAIARKIALRGTRGAHMFRQAFEANAAQVATIVERQIRIALETHRQGAA